MILERLSRVTAAMATPDETAEVLAFAVQVLAPQKTRPLPPEGKERDLYHLTDWYLSGRNGIALARDKETGALAGMMAVQAFDAPYHVEHIANVFDFATYYGYTAETAAVYRRTLIAEAYPRPQTLRAMVKVADAFARTQGYPPLLFEATGFFDRLLARKQAVFEADQEHERELQTLRRMQCHQLHAILPGLALAFAGFERRVRKKGGQFRKARFEVVGRAPKAARHVDELVEVLDA